MLRVKLPDGKYHIVAEVDQVIYDIKNSYTGYTVETIPVYIMDSWTYGEAMYIAMVN